MGRSKKKDPIVAVYKDWHGDDVELSKRILTKHILRNHPEFFRDIGRLEGALAAPDEVVKKGHGSDVWWVNKEVEYQGQKKYLRVCVARERGRKTIRTAFLSDSPKRGVTVWRKK